VEFVLLLLLLLLLFIFIFIITPGSEDPRGKKQKMDWNGRFLISSSAG